MTCPTNSAPLYSAGACLSLAISLNADRGIHIWEYIIPSQNHIHITVMMFPFGFLTCTLWYYPTDEGISIGHLVPSVGVWDPSQLGLKSRVPKTLVALYHCCLESVCNLWELSYIESLNAYILIEDIHFSGRTRVKSVDFLFFVGKWLKIAMCFI